ncbi:MAG: gliding motility-associated C-terminal domain-containing protein, partial [Bacteroidota bacterium]|nr:gliding motility-associated C-terminal domain-containing protein [Bacteroidota bacterium]
KTLLLNAYSPLAASYTWQDQSSASTYAVNKPGTYSVKVTGVNGCVNSDTIAVSVTAPPYFSLGNDTVLCETDVLNYNFNLSNVSYLWNDGSIQNSYTINKPGIYSLAVTQAGCSIADSVQVSYKPRPRVSIGNDTTLCAGNSIVLNALNAGATYIWQDASTQSFYAVAKAGIYSVTANLNGCKAGDTILINYTGKPSFTLGNDTMICTGQLLVLQPHVEGALSYLWQDGSTQQMYTVTQPGYYALRVSNECGTASDDISITTFTCDLTMPNAFTPNNDGLNDIFKVKYPYPVKEFHMNVYNQWGQRVFESTDITHGWDGKYKGIPASQGTYAWTISLTDSQGKSQHAKGVVTLLK